MHIVALKSPDSRDRRSVIHPDTVEKISTLQGITFSFESGIGNGINISDKTFINMGLKPLPRDECLSKGNLIITPTSLSLDETVKVQSGSTVLARWPRSASLCELDCCSCTHPAVANHSHLLFQVLAGCHLASRLLQTKGPPPTSSWQPC